MEKSTQETKATIIDQLQRIPASRIPELPEVADRFKNLYLVMNNGEKNASVFYEAEKFHFMKTITENEKLKECSKLSLYGCFLDVAVSGLSFDPSMKHVYLTPYKFKVAAKNGEPEYWENRCKLVIGGQGELALRIKQGQIKHADNPVLVYEGDEFSYGTKDGKPFINHVAMVPRKSDNIIACYLRITRTDGSVDQKVLSMEEILKLKAFSKSPTSLAWTAGLPGMVEAKTIKHAFKSYPKVRYGMHSTLNSEIIEPDPVEPQITEATYGLNQEEQNATLNNELNSSGFDKKEEDKEPGKQFLEDDDF